MQGIILAYSTHHISSLRGREVFLKMEFLSSRETAGDGPPYFGRDSSDGIHSFTIKCWQETGQKLAYVKTNLSSHLHILGFLLQI